MSLISASGSKVWTTLDNPETRKLIATGTKGLIGCPLRPITCSILVSSASKMWSWLGIPGLSLLEKDNSTVPISIDCLRLPPKFAVI